LAHEVVDTQDGHDKVNEVPYVCFQFFAVVDSSLIIFFIAFVQATNLFVGSMISSQQKSMNQPRIVFCSFRSASDWSLLIASMVSQGIGSLLCKGSAQVSKARRGA
jgi:hypothetical protein